MKHIHEVYLRNFYDNTLWHKCFICNWNYIKWETSGYKKGTFYKLTNILILSDHEKLFHFPSKKHFPSFFVSWKTRHNSLVWRLIVHCWMFKIVTIKSMNDKTRCKHLEQNNIIAQKCNKLYVLHTFNY